MRVQSIFVGLALLFSLSLTHAGAALADAASVGKVTRIQGGASASGRDLSAASPVYDGDLLITEPGARLEITFIDGSLLTLGGPAQLFIDEMAYSPTSAAESRARQTIESLEGAFRFVTGAVGRENPEAVTIATPVATIGIRGTDFWGGPIDRGVGSDEFGVLIFDGAVVITNENGEVTLDDMTEGTFISAEGADAPTDPGNWRADLIDTAVATITFDE